ncbi:hypothetical protein [Williamsia sterculiae]|nr:hypothetical protein [Williamsia sterculiae]
MRCALVPSIVLSAAVVAVVPGPTTFDDERSHFDALAQRVAANPSGSYTNVHIGPFDIKAATLRSEDKGIYLYDADATLSFAGWVYAVHQRPSYYPFSTLKDLGGGWYEFVSYT